jgi:GntR family transcriptional repressor for pyruvate dehydrogenase complex
VASKYEEIAASLINDILNGRYGVGERLPSERDLATRFDANRGSVREAMKKLEQIGLVDVQPGGARVKGTEEASLDVIGHLLEQDALPDTVLVEQILIVLDRLMTIAAEQTAELASNDELDAIREIAKRLHERELDDQAHTLARFELMNELMQTSRNLPIQLIARTLFHQLLPNMAMMHPYVTVDREAYADLTRQLDGALQRRDLPDVRATFTAFSDLNRDTMMRALSAARQAQGSARGAAR